jgi:hypothetical protein
MFESQGTRDARFGASVEHSAPKIREYPACCVIFPNVGISTDRVQVWTRCRNDSGNALVRRSWPRCASCNLFASLCFSSAFSRCVQPTLKTAGQIAGPAVL